MRIEKDAIQISYMERYCPFYVLIEDTHGLNKEADRLQKAKGKAPLFDYDDENCDLEDWYNFYLLTDGNEVTGMEYEYGLGGDRCGEIEIDEQTKQNAWEAICEYYGGEARYKEECKEFDS